MATMGPIPNPGSRPCASLRPRGKRFSLAVGTVLAVVLISSPSSAETSPRGELEDFFGGVTAILSVAISANQAQDDLRNLARALFDGREAARRALGPAWDGRTGAEREEFIRIFTGVVEHAFLEFVQSRLPGDRPPAVRVVGEGTIAERDAVVRTEVQAKYGDDIRLDYVMNRSGKGWLVRDVVITRDEIEGLMGGLLATHSPPAGRIKLTSWARENASVLGRNYATELGRRRDRDTAYAHDG